MIYGATLYDIEGVEITEFAKSKPVMVASYTDNFKRYLKQSGYFASVTGEKTSGKALIVESKTAKVYSGIRGLTPSVSIITVKVSDADTGKQLGSYEVKRKGGRQPRNEIPEGVTKDFVILGEEAGSELVDKIND